MNIYFTAFIDFIFLGDRWLFIVFSSIHLFVFFKQLLMMTERWLTMIFLSLSSSCHLLWHAGVKICFNIQCLFNLFWTQQFFCLFVFFFFFFFLYILLRQHVLDYLFKMCCWFYYRSRQALLLIPLLGFDFFVASLYLTCLLRKLLATKFCWCLVYTCIRTIYVRSLHVV